MEPGPQIIYQCGQCNKRFPTKQMYNNHEITHDLEEVASWIGTQPENVPVNTDDAPNTLYEPPHKKLMKNGNSELQVLSDTSPDKEGLKTIQQQYMLQESKQPFAKNAGITVYEKSDNNKEEIPDGVENNSKEKSETITKLSTGNKKPRKRVKPLHPKVFECDECSRTYTRRDHLNRHKLSHSGDRPFVCSVCLKSFIRKDKLQRHERIHNTEKLCGCEICGKMFSRNDMLKKHLKVHSEDGETWLTKEKKSPKKKKSDMKEDNKGEISIKEEKDKNKDDKTSSTKEKCDTNEEIDKKVDDETSSTKEKYDMNEENGQPTVEDGVKKEVSEEEEEEEEDEEGKEAEDVKPPKTIVGE